MPAADDGLRHDQGRRRRRVVRVEHEAAEGHEARAGRRRGELADRDHLGDEFAPPGLGLGQGGRLVPHHLAPADHAVTVAAARRSRRVRAASRPELPGIVDLDRPGVQPRRRQVGRHGHERDSGRGVNPSDVSVPRSSGPAGTERDRGRTVRAASRSRRPTTWCGTVAGRLSACAAWPPPPRPRAACVRPPAASAARPAGPATSRRPSSSAGPGRRWRPAPATRPARSPSSIGAVMSRQTSKPRNRFVISPGGKAPAWVATIGAPKSTPLAWVQRIAPSSPAAAVAVDIRAASKASRWTAPSPKPR